MRHREKWRLALDMLDEAAGWQLTPPLVVADAGYGDNANFRDGLTARGWTNVVQVDDNLTAHPADAVPEVKPRRNLQRRSRWSAAPGTRRTTAREHVRVRRARASLNRDCATGSDQTDL